MGYLKIPNLYQVKHYLDIFKSVYVLEKIHGTSAHVKKDSQGNIHFFSGEQRELFKTIHSTESIRELKESTLTNITIFGECYGYKVQKFGHVYGPQLKFVAFDVKIGDNWCDVDYAHRVCSWLGFEFVDYCISDTSIESINYHRDKPSVQAKRNGMGVKNSEGIVIRPLVELNHSRYGRIIAKHKRDDFRETKKPRSLDDKELLVLSKAKDIANEFVTDNRLEHVIQRLVASRVLEKEVDITDTGEILKLMVDDIFTEGKDEINIMNSAEQNATIKLIKQHTSKMFKKRLKR